MLRSSIDLGTNTCLLLIAECRPTSFQIEKVLWDESTIVRLGEGVDQSRNLQPPAMQRTLDCLKKYSQQLRKAGGNPAETVCVATSQARDATNTQEFFRKILDNTGFVFKTLSGKQEAEFTFLGALIPGMNPQTSAVLDIGGGSTELIAMGDSMSLDIGSVRFTERFLKSDPVTDREFWDCQAAIDQNLENLLPWREKNSAATQLVGVAGTITTLAAWHLGLERFDAALINSTELTRGDVHRMVEELKWRNVAERKSLPAMEPMRADVILAGALILWRALEVLGFDSCRVSTQGLRYGVLQSKELMS
ncbi:MAG: Ppx/GppA family phosphatase [Bdellovibrio sp.]|nr:Ppx/GppA family phosphatase [Bdellovibrio sp.]